MPENITRYELPPAGITLLGYVVRRMHKTRWLMSIPELIAAGKTEQALANIAMYAVTSSTSFGRAYYQPQFNSTGAEISEPDPLTGANVTAKLISTSPHYLITYTATMPNGDIFSGSEEITGTTVGLRGLGMPAPSKFNFTSGAYTAELTGVLTSELALSLIGRTRIRAYGFLNFSDNTGNTGKLDIDRNNSIRLKINGKNMERQFA
ncbi:MAG: hypothetical protein IPO36_02760 [Anaerolineales bacterium]|uniref:hypothetical protein n=1 Tax=Candidatus Villigracilis affinis TaxID=3140682 RepID=UPI001B41B056|nr:hypothetical protein [Anaerolineales bacterium]MBK9600754.1 hypothetical protein [Anaerolineales bacterium]MBL0344553.1 hypothetical protein [Anaerolineales bacterium]MBP8047858.1 hypothetical protein [Anaerolineales bacterium]